MEAHEDVAQVMKPDEDAELPAERTDRSALPTGMLEPVADPGEIVRARTQRSEMIAEALEEGRDYGSVQGIPKPFLQKPGAERLTDAFGCYPRFRILDQEVDHDRRVEWEKRSGKSGQSKGLYRYVVSCDLVHRASGIVVGNGLGVCSSMEDKYVESPRNSENTIAKMAKKRAHVDAALSTFGLSEMFTQDPDYAASSSGGDREFSPENKVGFGKHGDLTWRELVDQQKGYAEWAAENAEKISEEARRWLEGALVESDMEEQGPDLPDEDKSRQQARQRYVAECAKHFEEPEDARGFATYFIAYRAHQDPNVPMDGKLWRATHFEAATRLLSEGGEDMVADVLSWQMEAESEEPELFEGQEA